MVLVLRDQLHGEPRGREALAPARGATAGAGEALALAEDETARKARGRLDDEASVRLSQRPFEVFEVPHHVALGDPKLAGQLPRRLRSRRERRADQRRDRRATLGRDGFGFVVFPVRRFAASHAFLAHSRSRSGSSSTSAGSS